mmetsp:Transcript_13199/g.31014  ORF Transcript_13199/g.31014 Transcript_13199/m.31014 type:complete len:307 (-) Transcript_13199:61-981(-)
MTGSATALEPGSGMALKPDGGGAHLNFFVLKEYLKTPAFLVVWLGPCAMYLFLSAMYTWTFIAIPSICILLTVVFALASAVLFLMRNRGALFFPLSVGCVLATGLGTFVGIYTSDKYAVFPRFYANSRLYTNVVPSQPSAAVSDAGKIVFTSESFVDRSKSVSFVTEDWYTYCAAPVRDNSGVPQVEFWAVGIGCCNVGQFWCDSAGEAEAHAGIVVFDNVGIFGDSRRDYYRKAHKKAEATFRLFSVSEPTYVRWTREDNMDWLSHQYAVKAALMFVFVGLAHVVALLGLAAVLWKPKSSLHFYQ